MIQTIGTRKRETLEPKVANIRVLHLINGEHFSGAERVQDLLSLNLRRFGYQVDFACLKPDKFPTVRQSNSDLFQIQMRHRLDMSGVNQIVQLVRERGYRILHAHTPRSLRVGASANRQLSIPLIYHVHSPVGKDSTHFLRNKINTWVESRCLRSANKIICVSNGLANYMRQLGHDPKKICVVNNGVPINDMAWPKARPSRCWTIGTMALFRPRKGTEVLLDTAAILKKNDLDFRLRAVGPFETTDYQQTILARAHRLQIEDKITWTGFQRDINQQFQLMDLFILPSLFGEGLPMVVLEAMAAAVPVIASRVDGISDAVRDEIDGLIFEPGNAMDLAQKIISICRNPSRWQLMSASAVKRQQTDLSDTRMAHRVADVYDEVLELERQPANRPV
jgi:glycosyltransferase involved in cell wall biosynthesis